jgi:hypothetical protein
MPPAPRRVDWEEKAFYFVTLLLFVSFLFFVPSVLVGGYLTSMALWASRGHAVDGTVTGATMVSVTSNKGSSHHLEPRLYYTVTVDGVEYDGYDWADQSTYQKYYPIESYDENHRRIAIRFYQWGWLHYTGIPRASYSLFWVGVILFGIPVLIWIVVSGGLVLLFTYFLWLFVLQSLRSKKLYTHGVATVGVIRSKRVEDGDPKRFFLKYEFKPEGKTSVVNCEDEVERQQYNMVHDGKQVTVLYDRENPQTHVIYEGCGTMLKDVE